MVTLLDFNRQLNHNTVASLSGSSRMAIPLNKGMDHHSNLIILNHLLIQIKVFLGAPTPIRCHMDLSTENHIVLTGKGTSPPLDTPMLKLTLRNTKLHHIATLTSIKKWAMLLLIPIKIRRGIPKHQCMIEKKTTAMRRVVVSHRINQLSSNQLETPTSISLFEVLPTTIFMQKLLKGKFRWKDQAPVRFSLVMKKRSKKLKTNRLRLTPIQALPRQNLVGDLLPSRLLKERKQIHQSSPV